VCRTSRFEANPEPLRTRFCQPTVLQSVRVHSARRVAERSVLRSPRPRGLGSMRKMVASGMMRRKMDEPRVTAAPVWRLALPRRTAADQLPFPTGRERSKRPGSKAKSTQGIRRVNPGKCSKLPDLVESAESASMQNAWKFKRFRSCESTGRATSSQYPVVKERFAYSIVGRVGRIRVRSTIHIISIETGSDRSSPGVVVFQGAATCRTGERNGYRLACACRCDRRAQRS
jgi:hypothetical protein